MPLKSDPHFIAERFTNPQYIEERTLSDRKVEIPQIRDNPDKRAEFIRDVIALANASRRRGEPGYLLFGIDDGWNIVGIEGQSVKRNLPDDYDPNDPRKIEKLQRETIEDAFNKITREYIAPKAPLLSYHHNYHGELVEGKRVSYLEIRAEADNAIAYEVKKDIQESKPPLQRSEAWERQGHSKGNRVSQILFCGQFLGQFVKN
jgi:predicted HTH transcriptional regulator